MVQKGKKVVTFALVSRKMSTVYDGCTYDREKVSTGMVDEKVTVISIFPEIAHFFCFHTETENALAAIGNIHEGEVIFSDKTGARLLIMYSACHLV